MTRVRVASMMYQRDYHERFGGNRKGRERGRGRVLLIEKLSKSHCVSLVQSMGTGCLNRLTCWVGNIAMNAMIGFKRC